MNTKNAIVVTGKATRPSGNIAICTLDRLPTNVRVGIRPMTSSVGRVGMTVAKKGA